VLRKNPQQSSLKLWNLVLILNEKEDRSNKYKLLSKNFKFAHSLPISSASVEQSFSTLKWLRNNLRSNLNEQTIQSLIMLQQDFHQMENFISEEMLEKFHHIHKQLIIRKNQKKNTEITINIPPQDKPPQEEEKTIDAQINKRKRKAPQNDQEKLLKGMKLNPSDENEESQEIEEYEHYEDSEDHGLNEDDYQEDLEAQESDDNLF